MPCVLLITDVHTAVDRKDPVKIDSQVNSAHVKLLSSSFATFRYETGMHRDSSIMSYNLFWTADRISKMLGPNDIFWPP